MKWLWLWMIIIAYAIWTVFAILDIIASVSDWIDDNIKEVKDDSQITPVIKKEWTGNHSITEILDYMEEYAVWWFWATIAILFIWSLGTCMASCVQEKMVK